MYTSKNLRSISSILSSLTLLELPILKEQIDSFIIDTTGEEIKVTEPVQKPSRPLGIWKGQVEISEDFYKTSSDILAEFGIEE
jgi:hypothetical protein